MNNDPQLTRSFIKFFHISVLTEYFIDRSTSANCPQCSLITSSTGLVIRFVSKCANILPRYDVQAIRACEIVSRNLPCRRNLAVHNHVLAGRCELHLEPLTCFLYSFYSTLVDFSFVQARKPTSRTETVRSYQQIRSSSFSTWLMSTFSASMPSFWSYIAGTAHHSSSFK